MYIAMTECIIHFIDFWLRPLFEVSFIKQSINNLEVLY